MRTLFNKRFNKRINSRWLVDKEALWLIESPTYLSKYTRPSEVYVYFILNILTLLAPTQSAGNLFHSCTVL